MMASVTLHGDRSRAESFGAAAAAYDRTRPRYPAALFDDLLGGRALRVLDVGTGTGIVAEALRARGCEVLGVEADPRMAAYARSKRLAVEVARFEAWDPAGRTYDLVTGGQSWHWVDPVAGAAKAAAALRPGGRLALFWNLHRLDATTTAALEPVYATHAPMLRRTGALGLAPAAPDLRVGAGVTVAGTFESPRVRTYTWATTQPTADWVAQIATFSDHATLPERVRTPLLAAVADVVDAMGGRIAVTYDTLLVTATRRAS